MSSTQTEVYTPVYTANTSQFMARRRAASHAQFLLPYLRPGMNLLDCGCGPGSITSDLAEMLAPGSVVGVDIGESQIELARAHAVARGLNNIRFDLASVYALPFPDATFDAILAHGVLEHLADPSAALSEMRRVLRPGGVAAVCSPDWGGVIVAPLNPDLSEALEFYKQIQSRNGGNTCAGRHLGVWMRDAGFGAVKMQATYECYESLERIAEYLAQRIDDAEEIDKVVSGGWVKAGDLERMSGALRAWSSRTDGLFAQAWVAAVGMA